MIFAFRLGFFKMLKHLIFLASCLERIWGKYNFCIQNFYYFHEWVVSLLFQRCIRSMSQLNPAYHLGKHTLPYSPTWYQIENPACFCSYPSCIHTYAIFTFQDNVTIYNITERIIFILIFFNFVTIEGRRF